MNDGQYARYVTFLACRLTPSRLQHCIGVMRLMQELAAVYSLDPVQAGATGLLHDAAKDMPLAAQMAVAEKAGLVFKHPCEQLPIYLHARASALVAAQELEIADPAVLDAIAAHSYSLDGAGSESTLAWCLRSADLLAPVKEWHGMNKLRSTVFAGKLDEAVLLQCGWLTEYLNERNIPVHPILTSQFETLSTRLQVDGAFFERW